jgi:hypothetical protein
MLVRLEGRADLIELARQIFHFNVIAEHISDFMRVGELGEAGSAGPVVGPFLDRQQARI